MMTNKQAKPKHENQKQKTKYSMRSFKKTANNNEQKSGKIITRQSEQQIKHNKLFQ